MNLRRYDYPSTRVQVSLNDGRTFQESVTAHHGDSKNPASHQELQAKFRFLAQDVVGPATADEIIETVSRLDSLDNVGQLTRLLGDGG
jgi:2-methylcitrate dehydratase PrpD